MGPGVSPATGVGDSESVSSIDDCSMVGAYVEVVGLGDSPATFVGDSDSDGVSVASINDGFSAGAYVGVYESSREDAGAIDGFFVGISIVSFPPPTSSDVGLYVGGIDSTSPVGDVGVYVGKVGKLDVTFEAIAGDSDDGRDDGIAVGSIEG